MNNRELLFFSCSNYVVVVVVVVVAPNMLNPAEPAKLLSMASSSWNVRTDTHAEEGLYTRNVCVIRQF